MPEFILEHRAEDGRCISDDVLSAFDEQDALIRYALATGSVAGTDRVCIGIKNTRNFFGEYERILAAIDKGVITWPEQEFLILELESPNECVELLLPVMDVHSPNLYEALLGIDFKGFQKNGFEYIRIRRFFGDRKMLERINPDFTGGRFYHIMGDRLLCVTDYDRVRMYKSVSEANPSDVLERISVQDFQKIDWVQAHEVADRNNDKIWEEFPEGIWMDARECSKCSKRYDAQVTTVKKARCPYCGNVFLLEWIVNRFMTSHIANILFYLLLLGIAVLLFWLFLRLAIAISGK